MSKSDDVEKTNGNEFNINATWKIHGNVDAVDTTNGTITLWFDGFDELQTVPIVPIMPKWLLEPEVWFYTSIPRDCVRTGSLENNTAWGFFELEKDEYLDITIPLLPDGFDKESLLKDYIDLLVRFSGIGS